LQPLIDKLHIPALRDRLALRTFICASLARKLETATFVTWPALALHREQALKDCYGLRLMLDLVEREEREKGETGAL